MRAMLILAACALGPGCTRANLGYGGGGGNGGTGGSGGFGGSGGAVDLSTSGVADMTVAQDDLRSLSTDLALGTECHLAERRCITLGGAASQSCSATDHWQVDRRCPFANSSKMGASCTNGYCDPPTVGANSSCDNGGPLEQVCAQLSAGQGQRLSCQPFITAPSTNPTGVAWWCAQAANAGAGGMGAKCTLDSQCHTGFCAANGTCLWACQTAANCIAPTAMMKCADVTIHVEGKDITTLGCIPN